MGDVPARRFVVTATPPTTNGDLHVGHLSGPYLAADVFTRAQRLRGHEVLYCSGGDDHQTYVVTTAARLGRDPVELAATCTKDIAETLRRADVEIDAFTTPDDAYRAFVAAFFADLHARGRLERRTWSFPCSRRTGQYLLEAFTTGYCPECLTVTAGAICEACGHPNDAASLLHPRDSTAAGEAGEDDVVRRDVDILVLPLEHYRARFEEHYAAHRDTMRPHVLQFVEELLAAPLPDFPVSYPASWGVPVGIEGFEGQVVNVWAEMLPGLIWMTEAARAHRGDRTAAGPWEAGSGYELVQFLGFDNTFYFSFAHLGLALAHGSLLTPSAIVTNEFYLLDGAKFSTSRRHLIWARDLVDRYGADAVRFYLSLVNPEVQQANFTEAEFVTGTRRHLHEPLRRIAGTLARHAGALAEPSADDVALLDRFTRRMQGAYRLETFSLRRAAETCVNLLNLLAEQAERSPGLALAGLRRLATDAEPLLPSLAATLRDRFAAVPEGAVPDLDGLVPAI